MDDDKTKILILAANPWETKRLGLDEEYQRIQELWENSDLRERFELRYYPALRGEALLEKVLKFKPHLIHFSGHGEDSSLVFTDLSGDNRYEVTKEALAQLFKLCAPDLKAVFLNACHSAKQADAIIEQVDYVIGMNAAIDDLAAINFSQGFYTALFNQGSVDIEQAFNAGLTKMAIAQIADSEQQKPVLQKRPKSFVPGYRHDVFISFADEDAQWAKALTNYLNDNLKQKLATADGFQLYTEADFNQLEHSATLLIIVSPAYLQQYQAQFEQIGQFAKQKPVFLVEYDACKRHESLKGLSPYKFWRDDDLQGMTPLTGDAYIAKANELVTAMAKRLIELKAQQLRQQGLEQEREQQRQECTGQPIPVSVFLNSAPEDLDLTHKIKMLLKEQGVECVIVPIERTSKVSAADISQDSENKISGCDAVLVLYEQTTAAWASKQIMDCLRLQRKRGEPLKIIALHKGKDQPELGIESDNLQIYRCPPKQIETYISSFIEALK